VEDFFGYENIGDYFTLFSVEHINMIGLLMVSILLLYIFRHTKRSNVIKYMILACLILSEVTLNLWYFMTNTWDIATTLPFQLCTMSVYLSIWMLISEKYHVFEIVFFIGIGGAIQAILTPELYYNFPHFRFIHFFIAHIAIILASLYMVFVKKYKPTLKSLWKSFLCLNVLAFMVFNINQLTGGNYMFLSRKPTNPSLLDYLGDYPWYILSLEGVAIILYFIMYMPFAFTRKRKVERSNTQYFTF